MRKSGSGKGQKDVEGHERAEGNREKGKRSEGRKMRNGKRRTPSQILEHETPTTLTVLYVYSDSSNRR